MHVTAGSIKMLNYKVKKNQHAKDIVKKHLQAKRYDQNRNIRRTLGVVHAHSWVVIDCRVPQESVIRIVSTMGTKESISYKMISHGSWYRQIEEEKRRAPAKAREEKEEEKRKSKQPSKERKREREAFK